MKSSLIFKANVEWGWLGKFVSLLLLFLNLIFVVLIFLTSPVFVLFGFPILILDFLLIPLIKSILRLHDFELHINCVRIKNKTIEWKQIKSISFQTGRLIYDRTFNFGVKLPVLQRIFVLDKEGKEYSAIIDIDYYSKKNRKENNIKKIHKFLIGMDKDYLVADWAEKR